MKVERAGFRRVSILIDTHGGTHGLRVEIDSGEVKIWEWREFCDPDEHGSFGPHIRHTSMALADCLALADPGNASQRDRVIGGATTYLSESGGEDHRVGDDDRPCDHFASYRGPLNLPHGHTRGEHDRNLTCGACGSKPSHDAGDARAYAPC